MSRRKKSEVSDDEVDLDDEDYEEEDEEMTQNLIIDFPVEMYRKMEAVCALNDVTHSQFIRFALHALLDHLHERTEEIKKRALETLPPVDAAQQLPADVLPLTTRRLYPLPSDIWARMESGGDLTAAEDSPPYGDERRS